MRISNSKKQLAKIIHENGGWLGGAEWAAQDKNPLEVGFWLASKKPNREPWPGGIWVGDGWSGSSNSIKCADVQLIENWHQTVLSRDEYFHLYPAPDAKPRFCGAVMWSIPESEIHSKNTALTQVDDIDVVESKPTIEQLAADYRNAKDYADRKQQEADAAKADVEAKLAELVAAGKALGLGLCVSAPESEMVVAGWRDLRVGDEVECVESNIKRDKYNGMVGRLRLIDESYTSTPYLVDFGGEAKIWCHEVKFIRRP